MEIGRKVMVIKKEKFDGRSRPSNDTYRKRYKEIFGDKEEPWVEPKEPTLSEMLEEGFRKEQEELNDDE